MTTEDVIDELMMTSPLARIVVARIAYCAYHDCEGQTSDAFLCDAISAGMEFWQGYDAIANAEGEGATK